MDALKQALIYALEGLFISAAVVCLLAVIPTTAYRLFLVLFEPGEEEHIPQPHGQPNRR